MLRAHGRIGRTILRERASKHVRRLVDLALIHIARKIVVNTHDRRIVEIGGHHRLLREIGSQVVVLHPEQRILRLAVAEIVLAIEYRTEGDDLATERGRALVVVGTLLEVVALHLARGNVAIIKINALAAPLVVDLVVVEKLDRLDTGRVGEELVAVQPILVAVDVAVEHQFEDVGEEVHLAANGLRRIIETSIGVVRQLHLAVKVAAPHDVLRHLLYGGEGDEGARGERVGSRLRLLFLLFDSSLGGLGYDRDHRESHAKDEEYPFHRIFPILSIVYSVRDVISFATSQSPAWHCLHPGCEWCHQDRGLPR